MKGLKEDDRAPGRPSEGTMRYLDLVASSRGRHGVTSTRHDYALVTVFHSNITRRPGGR